MIFKLEETDLGLIISSKARLKKKKHFLELDLNGILAVSYL